MPDQVFDGFTGAALSFLDNLERNNDRDWFADNKPTYEAEIKHPAAAFCAVMEAGLTRQTGIAHSSKVFRIHRDVRFSKDKRPYNAHLHISFTPQSPLRSPPMWFFGLGTERLSLGCGVFAFEKAELEVYRRRTAGEEGADLERALARLKDKGVRLSDPELKRVPAGYDTGHPRAELLRHKGLGVWLDFPDRAWVTQPGAVERTLSELAKLRPVFDWLAENSG